jgi:hypothetical protein
MSTLAKSFDLLRRLESPIPKNRRYQFDVKGLKKGAFFRYKKRTFMVEEVFVYEERNKNGKCKNSWQEFKLYCLEDEKTSYLEWEEDDEIEIYFCATKLKLKDIGMSITEVEKIADKESGEIRFDGENYAYDDDYRAFFRKEGALESECYFYDFESSSGESLSVEAWVDEGDWEYEVYRSASVSSNEIDMISVGG